MRSSGPSYTFMVELTRFSDLWGCSIEEKKIQLSWSQILFSTIITSETCFFRETFLLCVKTTVKSHDFKPLDCSFHWTEPVSFPISDTIMRHDSRYTTGY